MSDPGLITAAVRDTLKANSGLTSIVPEARIFQGWGFGKLTPVNTPIIALTSVDERDMTSNRGAHGFTKFLIDVDVFGYNADQVGTVRGLIKLILNNVPLVKPTGWKNLLCQTLGGGPSFAPTESGLQRQMIEVQVIAQLA